jgi:hypothetical protein
MKRYRVVCYATLIVAVLFDVAIFWVRSIKSSSARIGLARYMEIFFYVVAAILVVNFILASVWFLTKRTRVDCLLLAVVALALLGIPLMRWVC